MPTNPPLGFDSNEYTSEGEFYRSNSPEQLRLDEKRNYAFGGGLLKGITELPLELLELMSPADEYVPGALAPDQSSPRQRLRTERLHGEQFYDELKTDPDTAQAAEVGYGTSFVVDPIIDTGIGLAPHLVKGFKAISKGERAAPKLANLMSDEVGAIGDVSATAGKVGTAKGETVSGLEVTDNIPNTSSISASLPNYEEEGMQVFNMSDFKADPYEMFYAKDDIDRVKSLAKDIDQNKYIDPLIVVEDAEGLYVLEGGHRLSALHTLGKEQFPALKVKDLDSLPQPTPVDLSKQSLSEVFSEARAGKK